MTKQNKGEAKIQIGKKGLTEGLLEGVDKAFNTRKKVKINVLKAATRDRQEVKDMAKKIINYLEESGDEKYEIETRGFTIKIRKG